MIDKFWKAALAIGGLATVGAFLFWSLYAKWLALPIFSALSQDQTFFVMLAFLLFAFVAFAILVVAHVGRPTSRTDHSAPGGKGGNAKARSGGSALVVPAGLAVSALVVPVVMHSQKVTDHFRLVGRAAKVPNRIGPLEVVEVHLRSWVLETRSSPELVVWAILVAAVMADSEIFPLSLVAPGS